MNIFCGQVKPRKRENGILDKWRKNKISKNDRCRESGSLEERDGGGFNKRENVRVKRQSQLGSSAVPVQRSCFLTLIMLSH